MASAANCETRNCTPVAAWADAASTANWLTCSWAAAVSVRLLNSIHEDGHRAAVLYVVVSSAASAAPVAP